MLLSIIPYRLCILAGVKVGEMGIEGNSLLVSPLVAKLSSPLQVKKKVKIKI